LKYWLLTTEYPPEFGGGIGTYCSHWSSILNNNGVELTVFVLNKNEKNFKETIENNIRRIDFSPYLKDTSEFLGYETMVSSSFEEIVRLFIEKEGSPDWLEAQEYHGIAYFILQKKHLGADLYKNLRIVVACHCPSFITFEHNHVSHYQLPYFWIAEMEKFCMKAANLCVFPSQYLCDEILSRCPGLVENYSVLHNPYIIANDFASNNHDEQDDFAIIGKLSPAKGILTTLKVFEDLWKKGYNYKLKLIGDENYFYHAADRTTGDLIRRRYASQVSSGLLTITGALTPVQVKKEIETAKIILVPSTVENFPYTVIESMAVGKIVLASTQGGQREIIRDGHNGFLFDHDDPSGLEEKIRATYTLKHDSINSIATEAINTIKNECDPHAYYKAKLDILEKHTTRVNDLFPFVSSGANGRISNGDAETEELLSVVIPYFNLGKYIVDAIASIDASVYSKKEIIIVNDGSNDEESINVLKSMRSRADIRVIDQENQGLSAARNMGALKATGKYLAFLDADDQVEQSYFESAINILQQKNNVHFVGCWIQYFDGANGKWPAFNPEPPLLLYHNMINSSSLVYRRSSFLEAGLNDSKFIFGMEDYDSVINLVKNGYRGVVIPEFLFFYRVRKGSMARGFNKSNKLYSYQLLAGKHKEFYTTFAAELFGLLNANGPGIYLDNPTLDYHITERIPVAGGLSKKLIYLVKKNAITRKMAYKIYRLLNK